MPISINDAESFRRLFHGNTGFYGRHVYGGSGVAGEKQKGESFTVKEPLGIGQYRAHLDGLEGLGVVPIDEKNECRFFAIDVDDYTGRDDLVRKVYAHGFPLIPFRSKSGGLHLYCFLSSPAAAADVINVAQEFAAVLGLRGETEIFPKQAKLKHGQIGNWINLPYYGSDAAKNTALDANVRPIPFQAFIQMIGAAYLTTIPAIKNLLESLDLGDGPPCLQAIALARETRFRNEYLFNLARYLKSRDGDEFEFSIHKYNMELVEPLPTKEIESIIASHKKKDYSYRCNGQPICDLCNRKLCATRKHGIGGSDISDVSFEGLTQFTADPPYYAWRINGRDLKFYSEADIILQSKFRESCMRELHVLPKRLKDSDWTKIVNRALSNIEIRQIESHEDMSPGSMLKELLYEFFERRVKADTPDQIIFDRVYKDPDAAEYVFRSRALLDFILEVKKFRYFSSVEIQDRLRVLGATPKKRNLAGKGSARVWALPFAALEKFIDSTATIEDEFEIDLSQAATPTDMPAGVAPAQPDPDEVDLDNLAEDEDPFALGPGAT